MRTFGVGCVLAAALATSGCFQMATVVTVNGDGSGTIDHTMLVTKAALAQLRGFAALGGGRGQRGSLDLTSEDQARSMAASLGPGVTYVSSVPIDTPLGEGRRTTYAFTDISQLRISEQPDPPGGLPVRAKGIDSRQITCTLTHEPNGNAVIHISLPEMKAPELPVQTTSSDATGEKNPALTQQLAMVRALLAGAKVSIAVEPAGRLVRTTNPYVDGSRVTLLDVDLDQLLGNEAFIMRLQDAHTPEELKAALTDVPGLKVPLEREVTIEFSPAK